MKVIVLSFIVLVGILSFKIDSSPSATGFDLELAKRYVGYGILSYCPKKCLEGWNCEFSKNYPKLINVTHVSNSITLAAAYIGFEP